MQALWPQQRTYPVMLALRLLNMVLAPFSTIGGEANHAQFKDIQNLIIIRDLQIICYIEVLKVLNISPSKCMLLKQ